MTQWRSRLLGRTVAPEVAGSDHALVLTRRTGGVAAVGQGLLLGHPRVAGHGPAEAWRPVFGIERLRHALILEGGDNLAEGFRCRRGVRQTFAAFQRFLLGSLRTAGVDI